MTDLRKDKLTIEWAALDQLRDNPLNPRKHSTQQIRQIARSIDRFGFNIPIVVDRNNTVIAGHGRLQAARSLGQDQVPIVRLEHLNSAQANALMVADNRLTDLSSFDGHLLGQLLLDLSVNIDLADVGYSPAECDLIIEGVQSSDADTAAEAVPAMNNAPPVSKRGDQWTLGNHTIRCGNALRGSDYVSLMGAAKAAIVFADAPYNVPVDGHARGLGRLKHREFPMASGEMSRDKFLSFLRRACSLLSQYSEAGSLHFICMDWRHTGDLISIGTDIYSELKNICVWTKSRAGMGSLYRSAHEFVLVFKSGAAKHRNNVQLGRHGRNRTNVWSYPSSTDFGRAHGEDKLALLHPTPKPVRMVADAILDCTARGDVVLDPFLGSGATLIAAERVGRVCHGMDLDPLYIDLAVRRWQAYTGEKAKHASTGKLFDQSPKGDRYE
jgi:DNA modification methylase